MTESPSQLPVSYLFGGMRRLLIGVIMSAWCLTSASAVDRCEDVCSGYVDLVMQPVPVLIDSIPELQMLSKPAIGPRGLRGHWIQRGVELRNEAFDVTFFSKNGLVQRIEMVSLANADQCRTRGPWRALVTSVESWIGQSAMVGRLVRSGDTQESAHLLVRNADIAIYLTTSPNACATRVVFTGTEMKDGSAL